MKEEIIPGKIIKGTVSGIETYGIFVNFSNNYSGMIHISEVSDKFVKDLNEYAKIGEEIPCKILNVDHKNKKLKLSIKNMDFALKKEKKLQENFESLKKMLPIWMKEKMQELKQEKND